MCPWAHICLHTPTLTHLYTVRHASCSYILSTLEQLRVQRSPGVSLVLCLSLMRRNILSTPLPSSVPFLWWEEVPGQTEASSYLATMKSKVKDRGCGSVRGALSSPTRSPGFHHRSHINPAVVVRTRHPGTQTGTLEIQGHPPVPSKFEVSRGFTSPCQGERKVPLKSAPQLPTLSSPQCISSLFSFTLLFSPAASSLDIYIPHLSPNRISSGSFLKIYLFTCIVCLSVYVCMLHVCGSL